MVRFVGGSYIVTLCGVRTHVNQLSVSVYVNRYNNNNNNNNLTNSYWSIGSTKNVKEDRARNKRNRGHGNTVSMRLIRAVDTRY